MQSSLVSHSPHVVLVVPPLFLVSLFSFFFILILITLFQLLWNVHPKDTRLPPGSMGWPYLGETLRLYTENPNSFFSNRQKRYFKQMYISFLISYRLFEFTTATRYIEYNYMF